MIKPIEVDNKGSHNARATITEEDVLKIRNKIHINKEEPLEVYKTYKDVISYSAFTKVITGETWTRVDMSMIKPVEAKREGKPKAKLNWDIVKEIRRLYESGEKTLSELYKDFYYVTPNTIRRVVKYETWKPIEPVSTIPEA